MGDLYEARASLEAMVSHPLLDRVPSAKSEARRYREKGSNAPQDGLTSVFAVSHASSEIAVQSAAQRIREEVQP